MPCEQACSRTPADVEKEEALKDQLYIKERKISVSTDVDTRRAILQHVVSLKHRNIPARG